ncbi:MAG: type II secretion system major pseudopilin GspG [Armatimonadota bacterium]
MPHTRERVVRRNGFTLIELLVVMVILALLAGLVVPKYIGRQKEARRKAAITQIGHFNTALDLYQFDNARYPTTQQGLDALIREPTTAPKPKNWKGPYLKQVTEIPKDPWGNEYQYVSPGKHSEDYDLWSYGADGREGGEGLDADIQSWNLPQE